MSLVSQESLVWFSSAKNISISPSDTQHTCFNIRPDRSAQSLVYSVLRRHLDWKSLIGAIELLSTCWWIQNQSIAKDIFLRILFLLDTWKTDQAKFLCCIDAYPIAAEWSFSFIHSSFCSIIWWMKTYQTKFLCFINAYPITAERSFSFIHSPFYSFIW